MESAYRAPWHARIALTLDTYFHVLPDMQERASQCLDDLVMQRSTAVMLANR